MRKIWGICFVLAGAMSLFLLLHRRPSVITPDDIVLTGAFQLAASGNAASNQQDWYLTVEMTSTASPLVTGDRGHFLCLHAFYANRPLTAESGQKDTVIGNDGRTYPAAVRTARDLGYLPVGYSVDWSEGAGALYVGTEFPAQTRFAIPGPGKPEPPALIVLSYFENRFPRDIVWTRVLEIR